MAISNNKTNYNSEIFKNGLEIDNFFSNLGYKNFSDWFNTKISKTSPWTKNENKKEKSYTIDEKNWRIIWSYIPVIFGKPEINLIEFLCINSIMVNETGGKFIPVSELVGNNGNPGISYAFNDDNKKSYNTLVGNKTAFQCFNDSDYLKAHGTKPMASILANTTDVRWKGTKFPFGFSELDKTIETSTSGKSNGFLIEADFFKFRGRGFIQTTGRANYIPLINYVLDYSGADKVVNEIRNEWLKYSTIPEKIATISTNAQWDKLFMNTDYIVANYAVYIHSKNKNNYLNINPDQIPSNLQRSIENVGVKVSGSIGEYSKLFLQRVQIQIDEVNSNFKNDEVVQQKKEEEISEQKQDVSRSERSGIDPDKQKDKDSNIQISSLTTVFGPKIKPGPIIFDIKGNN